MTTKSLNPLNFRKVLAGLALAVSTSVSFAQFLPTGAGPYDYDDLANWNGGTINNQFNANPTADQTVFFDGDLTLSSGWSIANTSLFNRSFVGSGDNRTITLGGNLSLDSSTTNANTVTIGSAVAGEAVNIDLGDANRTFSAGTNRTLEVLNGISGARSLTKTGAGTLKLTGTANTFTGNISLGASGVFGGVLEVTKIADSGGASSIGAGSGITFGGSGGAATLRYVGSGDSSNRSFTIGSQGAIFDASGSGAIHFTRTSAIDVSPSNTVSRTLTFTGTNDGENSFAGVIRDPTNAATSVVKDGTGKWVLAGANTYTGNTTITAGTLVLGAAGSITNSAAIDIAAGAVFDTTEQSFTMLDAQEINFTLDPTAGGSAGMLIAGALDISAGSVDFTLLAPLDDDVYVLASYTSLTGANFGSVSSLPSGYTIDYAYNGGTQIALVIPEPGTIGLLTGGLCAVLIFGRKRRGGRGQR